MDGKIFQPRVSQQKALAYQGGTMGISAVPGSGKTFLLSALAAKLITQGNLRYDQEVLVVTLVNSAVENFATRIRQFIEARGLAINVGYRIRTLHGLANDIVRENPSLVGLESGFSIVEDREAETLWGDIVRKYMREHPEIIHELLIQDLDKGKRTEVLDRYLPMVLQKYGLAFCRSAKDLRKTPEQVAAAFTGGESPLLKMGLWMYENYQRALALRGAVDFDDLIALALSALENSPELLERLRQRFPFILEDEAQDSSSLQERILGMLSSGNWVRVGDPNQAVYETFTTAKPDYLINFNRHADQSIDLPESGRCQPAIIELANDLIRWVNEEHPDLFCRDALTKPYIEPTPIGDPQPNPPTNVEKIYLIERAFTSEDELHSIANAVRKWIEANPEKTVAVLSTQNKRGSELVPILKAMDIEVVELLASTNDTRLSANRMGFALEYLEDPASPQRLENVSNTYFELCEATLDPQDRLDLISAIKKLRQPEGIFDAGTSFSGLSEPAMEAMDRLRKTLALWCKAVVLPIDSLIITLAQGLTQDPIELAVYHKMAKYLRDGILINEHWGLHESIAELRKISANQRKFLGMGRQDTQFDPDQYPGKVVVTTMHKAKGLEWDKVYLMSVNNYDFPSMQEGDSYQPEKYYIRNHINLEAEGIAQLRGLFTPVDNQELASAGPTLQARRDFVRERLRLLYVGITRARQEIALTWNTGKNRQTIAIPLASLRARYLERTGKQ